MNSLTVATAIAAACFEGISVNAGADRWERHGAQVVLPCDFERPSIAGRQNFGFALVTAVPYRTHRMNNATCRQIVALREFGVPGPATAQGAAFLKQAGSSRLGEWRHQPPRRRAERSSLR